MRTEPNSLPVAHTILAQLGNGFSVMTGAKDLTVSSTN